VQKTALPLFGSGVKNLSRKKYPYPWTIVESILKFAYVTTASVSIRNLLIKSSLFFNDFMTAKRFPEPVLD
jgi:hypothetical protein